MKRSPFAALGKLRSEREFLRLRASDPALLAFDEWLVDNMEWAARGAGPGFQESYAQGSVQAFCYRVPGSSREPVSLLAGALAPSADAAGRDFPFAVLTRVEDAPSFARQPETLPLLLEEVWQTASECVLDATDSAGAYLTQRLERLNLPDPPAAPIAATEYAEWTSELPLSELRELLFGEDAPRRLENALRFIVELVAPHRGVDHPKTPLSIRCPLGAAGGAAVCFWIDVVRRAARWRASLPSFFWSHDGGTGALLLHLGDAPKQTLAELWMPQGRIDAFCDVTQDIPPERAALLRPLPQPVLQLASAEGRPVREFLDVFDSTLT